MAVRDRVSRSLWLEYIVVLLVCATATAAGAAWLGQDINWDQRNYHLYTVHAWLTGRALTDLAPAQIQTWLNPLPYLPTYLLIQNARPIIAGMATGALSGVNGLLLWILARRLFDSSHRDVNRWCAGFVTVLGLTGSLFVSYLGTTFSECSPLVLAAVVCATSGVHNAKNDDDARFLATGCCLGAACGLKLTNLVYALGMGATLLVLWPFFGLRIGSLLRYVVGGFAGFLVAGGYWATKLWLTFRNPMFPFFNGIFRSRMYESVNFTDLERLPKSFARAAITYPFEWLRGNFQPSNPLFFREPRFAFVAVLLPLAMVVAVLNVSGTRRSDNEPTDCPRARDFWLVATFFVFSYVIWLKQFGVQRYILTLELLTGVVLLLCLDRVLRSARAVWVVLGLLVMVSLLWTRAPDWGRMPYGVSWFGLALGGENASPTLYVTTGGEAMAYVILYMPRADRFVRLGGNMPLEPDTPLGQRALRIIYAHAGPIRTLTVGALEDRARLQRFGLDPQSDSCRSFPSRTDTFRTCPALRIRTP